ncbi:MAG TPA: hypothetical protein VJB65_03420, partial [Patescibacteria group bacterium]|nr:hypothetical protein [Patescibacteria group bacterium]
MGLFRKKEPKIAQEKKERRGIRKSKFEVLVENELRLYDTSVGKIVSIVGEGDYQTTQELNDGTVTLFVTDAGNDQRENNIAKQVQELNDKNLDIDLLAIQSKLPQEVNGERVHDYALRIKPDGAATFVMNGAMDNSLVTVRNNKIVTNDSCYRSHHITGPLESRAMLSYYENERPEAILQFQTGDIVIILSEEASSSIAPIEIEKIVEYYKGNIQEIQKHLHKTSTVLLQQAQKKLTEIPDPAFLALKLNEGTIQVIQVQLPSAQVEAQPELVQSEPVQSAQAEPQQQQAVNEPATAEISDSTSNAPAQPEPIQSEQVQPKPETESRTKKWRQRLQSIAEKVKQLLVKSPAEQENTTPVADNTPSMRFNLMTPKPAEKKESTNKQKELQEFKDQLEALENQSQSDLDNQAKKISGLIQAHISLVNQDIVKKEAESNIELIKNLVRNTWMDLGNLNAEALHDALCKTSWQEKKEATKNAKGWEKFFSGSQSEVLNMLLKGASVRTVIALGLTAAGGFAFGSTTLLASGVAGITKGAVSITALRTGLSFLGMDAAATGWRFGHAESALSKQIDQAQSAEELAGRMHEFERLCVVLGKMPDENKVYQKSIDALAQKLQESGDDATKKYLQIMNNLYREEAKIDKQIRKKDWFWFAGKLTAASLLGSGVVAAKVFPAIKELSGFSEESAVKFTDKLMGWLQRPLTSVTDGIETVKEWLASIDHSGTSTDSALPLIESDAATPLPENEGELPIPGQDVDTPAPGDIDKTVANISVPASSANIEDTSSGGGVRGAAMPLSPDHAAGASGTVSTPVGDATSAVTSREVVAPSASADSTIVESARSAPADSSGSKSIVKSSETSTSPEHVAPATPLEQPVTLKETVGETQWKKMTVHAQTASGAKGEGISHALMRQYDSGVSEAMKNTTVEINGKSSAIYTDKAHSQVWVKDPEKLAVQIEGKKVCFYDAESGKPIPNNELGKYLEIKDPVAKPPLAK